MASKRSQIFLDREEFLVAKMSQCAADLFDYNSNRNGYVNLGTAQNFLCEVEIAEWLNTPGNFEHKSEWQHYTALDGHAPVRKVVAEFLTDNLHPPTPIDYNNLRYISANYNIHCIIEHKFKQFYIYISMKFEEIRFVITICCLHLGL